MAQPERALESFQQALKHAADPEQRREAKEAIRSLEADIQSETEDDDQ